MESILTNKQEQVPKDYIFKYKNKDRKEWIQLFPSQAHIFYFLFETMRKTLPPPYFPSLLVLGDEDYLED